MTAGIATRKPGDGKCGIWLAHVTALEKAWKMLPAGSPPGLVSVPDRAVCFRILAIDATAAPRKE